MEVTFFPSQMLRKSNINKPLHSTHMEDRYVIDSLHSMMMTHGLR